MPATSKKQKVKFCIALSIKLGKTKKSYSASAAKMAEEMTIRQLSDYCKSEVKE